jgi:hypothetical protein
MFEVWLTGFIIGAIIGMALYLGYCCICKKEYDKGFWAGRGAGWRAANQHYEKVRQMRSKSVFDYDKN